MKAFSEIQSRLSHDQGIIYEALGRLVVATDSEIAAHLGYDDPNKVRPRRFELVEQGLVEEHDRHICRVTGKLAIAWCIPDTPKKPQAFRGLTGTQMNKLRIKLHQANKFQCIAIIDFLKERLRYYDKVCINREGGCQL